MDNGGEKWMPVRHSYITDPELRETVHQRGYAIIGNMGQGLVSDLLSLYQELHRFPENDGGTFYSLYSHNLPYRRQVHDRIGELMRPLLDGYFTGWKSVINSFIVKTPGDGSAFALHQDSNGLDEMRYSSLSLWMPLQDTDLMNGCLCVVPFTHALFHPYRGISLTPAISGLENELRRHLVPITMRAGDILAFDSRLVHYSPPNRSGRPRITVLNGIFPQEATIRMSYRDESVPDSRIELWEQDEDYLVKGMSFYHDCHRRPDEGRLVGTVDPAPYGPVDIGHFRRMAVEKGLTPTSIPALMDASLPVNVITEPEGV